MSAHDKSASVSEPTVFITSFSKRCIIVHAGDCRIWLNREEAIQLLEILPGAINQMPVNPLAAPPAK
jgi:hypothetical protein